MLSAKPGKSAPADGKDNEKTGEEVAFMENKKKLPNTAAYKGVFLKNDAAIISLGKDADVKLIRLPGGGLSVVAPRINFISQSIKVSDRNGLFVFDLVFILLRQICFHQHMHSFFLC